MKIHPCRRVLFLLGIMTLGHMDPVQAQQPPAPPARKLVVGTKEAPPFSMKGKDGKWRGISVELWEEISKELGFSFEFKELSLAELLEHTRKGTIDAAVAALTITADREDKMDFTHPFFTSGLGIGVPFKEKTGVLAFLGRIFSLGFFKILGALMIVLLGVGLIVWLFERRKNQAQFGGGTASGLASGVWFSAVTMTTVGYGDKAPVTLGGRLVALVWMFVSIVIISSFTAAITTTLTVSQLESRIRGPEDLGKFKVATVKGSTSADYLNHQGVNVKYFPNLIDAMKGLARGKVDAVVYDAPMLRYLAKTQFPGKIRVLPGSFERQDYGFALPDKSPLREAVNRVLLRRITHPTWKSIVSKYLGR